MLGRDISKKRLTHCSVLAIHINFCIMPEPEEISRFREKKGNEISLSEQIGLDRANEFKKTGSSYALQHATRPSTIGFVLASNPVALLAW